MQGRPARFAGNGANRYPLRSTSNLALRQRKAAFLRQARLPPGWLRVDRVGRFTSHQAKLASSRWRPVKRQ